jgi:AcrR family transcriptional regulator
MAVRLTRTERSEQNRALLLDAARDVFLERGYQGATLEQIAERAGFTKGAVYSRFDGKADLFLALLGSRIDERARDNRELVAGLVGDEAAAALIEHFSRIAGTDRDWGLLVIEFRVHASRDERLNARYAALHERTIDELGELFGAVYERADSKPPLPRRQMAEFLLAMGSGAQLEHAANPQALGGELMAGVLTEVLTGSAARAGSVA